jgi:hypothetical protein
MNSANVTQKEFIEFLCHFMASCVGIIKNTLKSVCKTINSNNKPQETKIHSQGQKTLMFGTRMHVGPKVQSTRTKNYQTIQNINLALRT